MTSAPEIEQLDHMWARHNAEWRAPAQIASQWKEANETDPKLLQYTVTGQWWETLRECAVTLLVTREYEHLLVAMRADGERPVISFMGMPHPSGLTVDRKRNVVYVASTRNPNQVYDLVPVMGLLPRLDVKDIRLNSRPLVPVCSRFLPGCMYLHDLAMIGDQLYATAVGHNAVVRLYNHGRYEHVWWPKCIETERGPVFGQNHIQLNSIAAGDTLETSYFSASAEKLSARRPGHKNFPVEKRGVIFSGTTREPIARGLTRPHSARLYAGRVWVDNSGYGEVGYVEDGGFTSVARLPGWTRGLCFYDNVAFVGTSRVIPRFRQYAPGLDVDASQCGVHALNIETGQVLGSILWPCGNQVFDVDWVPATFATGFPFHLSKRRSKTREKILFYAFETTNQARG